MGRRTLDIQDNPTVSKADDGQERVHDLEMLVLHLEEEVARLKRERLEVELLSRRLVGDLEPQVRAELETRLEERQPLPRMLRNGDLLPAGEVPVEALLDLAEVVYWRHALAESTGLQTFLYLRDGDDLVPAANSPSQLPVLARCREECLHGVDKVVRERGPRSHALHVRCPGCGGSLWVTPLSLNHDGAETVLGVLVGHDVPEPADAHRRMISLVANLAGRRAGEAYAEQAAVVLDLKVHALLRRHVDDQADVVREARIAMLEHDRTSQDLARVRESLERALLDAGEARREAERANRVKSLFLAAMSHEIRTPLTCVIGFADLLTMPTLSPKEIRQFSASIKESGQILMSLINNVLDLSKVEAGRLELETIPFDLRRVLKEVHTIFLSSTAEKGLEFRLEVAEDVPETVQGDPTRFRQVVMNLVSNAVKFTAAGSIRIRCHRSGRTPGFLSLSVSDTGEGIAADQLPHVFDSFRQADAGIGRRYGGTGLGLAISRSIVEEMGGSLAVESSQGEGSTFLCHFPVDQPDSPLPE